MSTAYVLYINDDIVGPCLELIRKVCDPISTSRPHITVRVVNKLDKNNLEAYRNTMIENIDFIEPGAFGLNGITNQENRTVFVKCASDILETLSHKPHYPDSVFHVTLYDGHSHEFASNLLQILKDYDWKYKVSLPVLTTLTKIEIKSRKKKTESVHREYSAKLRSLFMEITSQQLTQEYIAELSDENRLDVVRAICSYLNKKTSTFEKVHISNLMHHSDKLSGHLIGAHDSLENKDGQSLNSLVPDVSKKWTGDINQRRTNQIGLYLTPPELAKEIAEYATSLLDLSTAHVHFGDPAVGTGVFFSALCQVLPQEKICSAIGIELDPNRAIATHERWSHKGLKVMRGDYLHLDQLPLRTLILANPPYVRYQHLEPSYGQKLRVKASVNMGMQIKGQSGLYVYFLILSHVWMERDAVAAWLIPSEFMETNYGDAIRNYLTQKVQLIRIHRYNPNEAQFENALVSSSVVVFRNRLPVNGQNVMLSIGGSLKNPKHIENVSVDDLRREVRWSIPLSRRSLSSSFSPKLGDLFTICRGIATGANDFFVIERTEAARIGIPESALRPLLPKARTLEADVVEKEPDGYPKVTPQLCLIDSSLPEDEIRNKYPQFWEYLKSAEDFDVLGSTLVKRRNPWYRQEEREPPLFLCTYMGRGSQNNLPIRFIWNKSNAVALNVYLLLYPREKLFKLLSEQPELQADVFAMLQETALRGLNDYGRMYGGGLRKIEPRELLEVRLASFPKWLEEVVDRQLF